MNPGLKQKPASPAESAGKVQLQRPERAGKGLQRAGAFVVVVVLVISFISFVFGGRSEVQLTPQQGSEAADRVEELTKELIERERKKGTSSLFKVAAEQPSSRTLNGVQFRVSIPLGWTANASDRQIIVRKSNDPRICQITADSNYDTDGLISDVKETEVDFESQYLQSTLGLASPQAKVVASGVLIMSAYGASRVQYVVRTRVKMSAGGRSIENGGVNAVYALGPRMVRIQCMNMSGTADDGEAMTGMGRSLVIQSADSSKRQ